MLSIPVEERLAIQELVALYAIFCDTHRFPKLVDLFVEDCDFDETSVGAPRATSKAVMAEMFRRAESRLGPVMHNCTSHVISEYDGNTAAGMCHVFAEGAYVMDGYKPFRIFGYYDDRYEKQADGRWYFKSRVLRTLIPSQGAVAAGAISYEQDAPHFRIR